MPYASLVAPFLPSFPPMPKSYAKWPVWKDSACANIQFVPQPKKQLVKLWHRLREWNAEKQPGRYGGRLGASCLAVAHCLIFDFLNYTSGRLDPSYDAIAQRTGLGRSTVATALARLKEFGVINWVRRCLPGKDEAGRFVLRQDTNAYAVLPASQWVGYIEPPKPPVPTPDRWGACPPLASPLDQAAIDRKAGDSIGHVATRLADDPADELACALARLARVMGIGNA
jgi:hypothetical protein